MRLVIERNDELRADLMEHYSICLDTAEQFFSPDYIAALSEQLPFDCRWRVAYDEDCLWNQDRQLLAMLVNGLNMLSWGMSDKKKRGKKPRTVGPRAWRNLSERKLSTTTMTREKLIEELNKPRREVQ